MVSSVLRKYMGVSRAGNQLTAIIGTDYSKLREEKTYDQIVVNKGILPMDDLYFDLKPYSKNEGAVDYEALIAGHPQQVTTNPEGKYRLFRIGDAVSARNTHAAIYDALRLMKDI